VNRDSDPQITSSGIEGDQYYNPVFEKLSAAPTGPLTGAVAYALYKVAKREWVRNFQEKNGRAPTEPEYRSHAAAQTSAVLNAYVAQADQILGTYAQNVISTERPKIVEDALRGDFSRSFWPSFWASVAFAALLLLLGLVAALLGFGLPIQITIPRAT
jgi:hypothetical protein